MATPYVGEIRMFAGNFAPVGWQFCAGQLLSISENETLFQLIGTTYGGDGESTFALPDLQSRIPIHQGQGPGLSNYVLSETGGVEEVTLTVSQIPTHSHAFLASTNIDNSPNPSGNVTGSATLVNVYRDQGTPAISFDPNAVTSEGNSLPHSNIQPYLCVNFIIAMFGIYPTPT